MAHENDDDSLIRRYLLGQVTEDERQQLEEKMMADTELYNRAVLAEDEMVEEYVQGELPASERASFEASFLRTADGRKQVSFARALSKYVSSALSEAGPIAADEPVPVPAAKVHNPVWWRHPALVPYFKLAAAAVIVLGLSLGIWRVFFYQSDVSKGMAALAQAYREQRPIEARITGLKYAPVANTRGGELGKADQVALDRAERILLDAVFEHPGPASHHALGNLYLAEQKFEKATGQFEEALKADPNNAQLHSDYGAALLEKGKAGRAAVDGKSLEDFAKSLEHLSRAIELNGSLLEALFNRAILYQNMMLSRQAAEDWAAYLEKDPQSHWSDEARQNLKSIQDQQKKTSQSNGQVLQDFLGAYRLADDEKAWGAISQNMEATSGRLISWQLLDAFFDATTNQRADYATRALEALSYEGQLEKRRGGDSYTSDVFLFYRAASAEQLSKLDQAHTLFNRGLSLCLQAQFAKALDVFKKANKIFSNVGNRMEASFADIYIGYCYLNIGNTAQASTAFRRVIRTCERANYKWLGGLGLNALSSVEFAENKYSSAIAYTTRALKIAEQMGDTFNIQRNLTQLADDHKAVGDYNRSVLCLQRCLDLAETHWPGPKQMWFSCDALAEVLTYLRLYAAAEGYEREALRLAVEELRDPSPTYQSHVRLGIILGKRQEYDQGIEHLKIGYEIAKGHSPDADGQLFTAYSSLQLGHLYRQTGDFSKALSYYDQALAIVDRLGFHAVTYDVYKGRLLCHIAEGNDDKTQKELQTVLRLSEDYRSKILEERNRNRFFDIEQSVYDLAIDFEYSRMHDDREAFKYSEASRARSLLDLISSEPRVSDGHGEREITFTSHVFQPLTLSAIQERIPDQAQILQYSVLENRLLIWAIGKGQRFAVVEQPVSLMELNEKVLAFRKLIASSRTNNQSDAIEKGTWLYNILIKPVEAYLDRNKQICLIPDKILNYLPFNALVSPAGHYLAAEYLLSFSPSSSVFILCTEAARRKQSTADERILSLGNPQFDREQFPLDELPSATREAREIARCYSSSCLLTGSNAREEAVLNQLEVCDVAHLASHYIVNESSPMLSKLVLAKEAEHSLERREPDGVLQADEIYQMRLSRLRLVVLSACQTGIEHYYNGEGMIGMSRPFIAGGVPLVVASLWPVDSDSTAELMIKFHRYRKGPETRSTTEALRSAQLDMIADSDRHGDDPHGWASFIVIGGYARF